MRLQEQRLQNSFEFGGYETLESFILIATKSFFVFGKTLYLSLTPLIEG